MKPRLALAGNFARFLLLALLAPGIARAEILPIHDAGQEWYAIEGATELELRAQLDRLGPEDEAGVHRDGLTRWDIRWELPPKQDRCSIATVTVSIAMTVVLPLWHPPGDASAALLSRWQGFLAALVAHEQAHVDLVVAELPAVRDALAAAGCSRIAEAGRREVERLRALHAGYDDATDHGRATGAVFP